MIREADKSDLQEILELYLFLHETADRFQGGKNTAFLRECRL